MTNLKSFDKIIFADAPKEVHERVQKVREAEVFRAPKDLDN